MRGGGLGTRFPRPGTGAADVETGNEKRSDTDATTVPVPRPRLPTPPAAA